METDIAAARGMALLRRQRHSFLNHLQVISGWLQLERPERAHQYLDRLAGDLAAQNELLRSLPEPVGFFVLEMELEAESFGIRIVWQLAEPFQADQLSAWLVRAREAVVTALSAAASQGEGQLYLPVTIGASGVTVHTPTDKGKG